MREVSLPIEIPEWIQPSSDTLLWSQVRTLEVTPITQLRSAPTVAVGLSDRARRHASSARWRHELSEETVTVTVADWKNRPVAA